MNGAGAAASAGPVVGLSLHGILHFHLIDPAPHHIEHMTAKFGATPTVATKDPDLVIRYTEEVESGPLTVLGLVSAAFSGDDFFLIDRDTGVLDARIPFGELSTGMEIQCRSALRAPPLLLEMIRLLLLTKHHVAVHGAGVRYKGRGVLTVGWAKGGKTGAMLAYGRAGASYVGDEWVILSPEGGRMYGFPSAIGVAEAYLAELPEVAARTKRTTRFGFRLIHFLDRVQALSKGRRLDRLMPRRSFDRALPVLRRRLRVWVRPERIFAELEHAAGVEPEAIFLIMNRRADEVQVSASDPVDLADRMAEVNAFEWERLSQVYRAFRFAFPGRADPLIEEIYSVERALLVDAFAGKRCFTVLQRYPGTLSSVLEVTERYL